MLMIIMMIIASIKILKIGEQYGYIFARLEDFLILNCQKNISSYTMNLQKMRILKDIFHL